MRYIFYFSLALGLIWITPRVLTIQSTTANENEPISDRIAYPLDNPDLTGTWFGIDRTPVEAFTFTLQLVQTNNIITGTHIWSNGPTGTISGTIDGVDVTWTRYDIASSYIANFTGTISDDYRMMGGTWVDNRGHTGIWEVIRPNLAPFAFLNLPYDYTNSNFFDQSRDSSQDGNVGSFFDHLYPTSNDPPNLGLNQALNFNGYDSSQTLPLPSYAIVTDGNDGINFMITAGTPVLSAATGVVTFIGQVSGYCELTNQVETANVIKITHVNYYVSEYWHLSSFATDLVTNTVVTRDIAHPIGYAGDTGCTPGSLLHFVIRNPSGMVVDPYGWRPLPFSAWYGATDPWQQYNADHGGVDAVSHYLWLEPLDTITITHPSISTVLSSPSDEITVTISSGFFPETLRFDLSETLQPALIANVRSLRTFTFFGYTSQNLVITDLDNAVIIDLAGPNADQIHAITQRPLSMPTLRVWDDQLSAWVVVPITWDSLTGHVHAVTTRIGSFALTTTPFYIYLPMTLK
jgi:hypothetical protein